MIYESLSIRYIYRFRARVHYKDVRMTLFRKFCQGSMANREKTLIEWQLSKGTAIAQKAAPKGAVHKRRRNFLGHFLYPPPQCLNFNPDLPNPYLLIPCNIKILEPPPPLKISTSFINGSKR